MRWCVIRHPDLPGQPSAVSEQALEVHQYRGWFRVSDWVKDQTTLHPADFVDADEVFDEQVPEVVPAEDSDPPADEVAPSEAGGLTEPTEPVTVNETPAVTEQPAPAAKNTKEKS